MKDVAAALLSWITCSGGCQPPCHEDIQALQKDLHGKKLGLLANRQQLSSLVSHVGRVSLNPS